MSFIATPIAGVTYDFKRFVDAESDLQLAALLPEQKVLMAFDLVFSANQHAFTGANHFDHWLIVLELLKALEGYDTITIGHDTPVDRSAIDSTMTYVKRRPSSSTPTSLNDQLKRESESLELWNSFEPVTVTDQRRKIFNVRSPGMQIKHSEVPRDDSCARRASGQISACGSAAPSPALLAVLVAHDKVGAKSPCKTIAGSLRVWSIEYVRSSLYDVKGVPSEEN